MVTSTIFVPPAAADAAARIMVVGDSISQGMEGDFTWRYRLAAHLGTTADFVGPWTGTNALPAAYPVGWPDVPMPPVRNGGYRPGITFDSQHMSQWGWQMHQAKDAIAGQVSTYTPDYLLIELGFNDLAWGVNGPDGVLNDLRTLVANARSARPSVKILVANVMHRTPVATAPTLPTLITTYNGGLPATVNAMSTAGSPVSVVDLDTPHDENRDNYDGLHPNIRGEHVIAKAFADRLATTFGVGRGYGAVPTTLPAALTPGAPATIAATPVGDKIRVAWSHAFGATAYQFFQRDVTRGEGFRPAQLAVAADSWTADVLSAGHRMEFYVRAIRGPSTSAASPTAAATVNGLPAVPNLRVSTTAGRPHAVTLTWDPVAGADDYFVYAKPGGCDLPTLPAAGAGGYQMVQWALGSRTTWTQEFIIDQCLNYFVVAARFGGEGARPQWAARAWPFLGNLQHYQARQRFFDAPPAAGDQVARMSVAPGPDRGIVLARSFIRNKDLMSDAIGDHRGFRPDAYASSKVTVAWDTGTGQVAVYVHRSCAIGATFPGGPVQTLCRNALPIAFVANPGAAGDSNTDPRNLVNVARNATGGLTVTIAALNSWERVCVGSTCVGPGFGRVNATATLEPIGATFSARLAGDRYPAWEFIRYAHFVQGAPLGDYRVLGTRDQTILSDLTSGARWTCASPATETTTFTNPMACS
jgi:GDSL-like Lipase/Acylhydrolase family